MTFIRRNAWNNGGTFDNPDLLWYAKAVAVMKEKHISNPTSWWFYAAIHHEYLVTPAPPTISYLNWQQIQSLPQEKLSPVPTQSLQDTFWDQCTHSSWFFLPWHRGYLVSIEDKLRTIIIDLGGPSDWALPYWNYCNVAQNQNHIPPAFLEENMPDGLLNPLYVPERYGSDFSNLNEDCQSIPDYDKYGGASAGTGGILESNPHGAGHVDIGSQNENRHYGLMAKVPTAGLDPIFYLHHCNIDRMWANWNYMSESGNTNFTNPTSSSWLDSLGVAKRFAMPMDYEGTQWNYVSDDVTTTTVNYYTGAYAFTYDDISVASDKAVAAAENAMFVRLQKLNKTVNLDTNLKSSMQSDNELIGASLSSLDLAKGKGETKIKLEQKGWNKVEKSLLDATAKKIPDEVFLQLEGVKSNEEGNSILVYINNQFIERVALFGIESASSPDGLHGDSGSILNINITNFIDDLHLDGNFSLDSLDIKIETKYPLHDLADLTIERISIYRANH